MLRNRNIAFFIDVDNVDLSSDNYDNILAQLEGMGTIMFGKVYGAKERKHKSIYQNAEIKGYRVERPMRIKRRGRKDFDSRIFIDVVDAVCKAPAIDAVCVITASCDLVYLYSYLHGKGIKVISSEENEQASAELVDEIVDLGRVYEIQLPKTQPRAVKSKVKSVASKTVVKKTVRPVREVVVEQSAEQDDNTDELLREIERLRSITEKQQAEREAQSKSIEEAKKRAYEEARKEAEKEVLAKVRAEEEAKKKAEAEKAAREKAIEEARAKAYAEARQEAEKEAIAKVKAEEAARKKAEEEARKTAEEIEKIRAEREALEEKEAEARARAEQAAKAREKAIEEARAKAYEEARKEAEKEAIAKVKAEEEARKKALAEAKAREEELNRKIAELEARRVEEQDAKNDENAEELLREIEKLKRLTSETHQLVKEIKEEGATPRETIVEKIIYEPAHTASAVASAPTESVEEDERDDVPAQEKKIVETTTEVKTTVTPAEPTTRIEVQVPVTDENGETTYSAPRAYYIPQNDSTLIRKIEEIRNNSDDSDSEELLEEIRKLLEGLD